MCYERRDPNVARECWEKDQRGKKMAEYIEREALRDDIRESYLKLQEIYETLRYERERDICNGELGTFCEVLLRIKDFPAADVAPVVHGRWMDAPYVYFGAKRYECSNCYGDTFWNNRIQTTKDKYCPNCGARMDGE